uniref:Uncharacterized protein n=1 Tax=Oryza sativa subsp. japonica TaxID=39947 RepID=Q6EQV0_ORYSJ|nr:hypothetical protein [Oryza sativa Japonica Group]
MTAVRRGNVRTAPQPSLGEHLERPRQTPGSTVIRGVRPNQDVGGIESTFNSRQQVPDLGLPLTIDVVMQTPCYSSLLSLDFRVGTCGIVVDTYMYQPWYSRVSTQKFSGGFVGAPMVPMPVPSTRYQCVGRGCASLPLGQVAHHAAVGTNFGHYAPPYVLSPSASTSRVLLHRLGLLADKGEAGRCLCDNKDPPPTPSRIKPAKTDRYEDNYRLVGKTEGFQDKPTVTEETIASRRKAWFSQQWLEALQENLHGYPYDRDIIGGTLCPLQTWALIGINGSARLLGETFLGPVAHCAILRRGSASGETWILQLRLSPYHPHSHRLLTKSMARRNPGHGFRCEAFAQTVPFSIFAACLWSKLVA